MATETPSLVFGPVPSRRLGRSLGVNNIPPKVCSYSCVYCQLGRTPEFAAERREFYPTAQIVRAVQERVAQGDPIDYITFVPDGEPTLDANLGAEIDSLKPLGIPLAIITNASLLWREDVRRELSRLDFVSVKLDAADELTWRRINRPHKGLAFLRVLQGLRDFAAEFKGTLVTETMLVRGVNDSPQQLHAIAQLAAELKPGVAYLAVPIRPPAESWALPPDEAALLSAVEVFREHLETVEYLVGYEGNAFAATGDAEQDLLSITAVHPMREEAVSELLRRDGADASLLRELVAQGKLAELEFEGHRFYLRRFAKPDGARETGKSCGNQHSVK